MRIKVVGAGIYGCHIALSLIKSGYEVELIEELDSPLRAASGNNQFRIHQGFHYPRNSETRKQSLSGFSEFMNVYGAFTQKIQKNLYAIVKDKSVVDFETYKSIMKAEGLKFEEHYEQLLNYELIEGVINTQEEIFDADKLARYFLSELKQYTSFNTRFDFASHQKNTIVIDCTWGGSKISQQNCYFEPTVLFYYTATDMFSQWSLTLMDGDFWSIYRTSTENRFTLSHVSLSVLGSYGSKVEAQQRIKSVSQSELHEIRNRAQDDVSHYFPEFTKHFSYSGDQLSIKTKNLSKSADRSCTVTRIDDTINVMSGKLDTIFHAEREVFKLLNQ